MNFKRVFTFLLTTRVILGQQFSEPFNVKSYLGKWYQVYSDKFVVSTFEKDAKCVFSIYDLYGTNNISVYNQQLNSNNEVESINGYAFISNPEFPRKLTVNLDGGMGDAPYWIYELGPIQNNLYEYSIVSDQYKLALFVLARDVNTFFKEYNNEVLEKLKRLGFTRPNNHPILTDQNDC